MFGVLGWDPTWQRRMPAEIKTAWTLAAVATWTTFGGLAVLALAHVPRQRLWLPIVVMAAGWMVISVIQVLVRRRILEQLDAEADQNAARRIQAHLLPTTMPQLPGIDVSAHYAPYRHVGGDFYDAVALDDSRLMVAIADVSGKGMAAAFLTASLQPLLLLVRERELALDHMASAMNRHLVRHTDARRFVTMVFAVLDPVARQLSYVNAGHNPPLGIAGRGDVLRLDPTGPALGMIETATYTSRTVPLQPGTSLLFYTDGLTEWRNHRDQMFAEERVAATLHACRRASAARLLDTMLQEVAAFAGGADAEDDVTMVAVHVRAKASRPAA